jgi:hypothetical protein
MNNRKIASLSTAAVLILTAGTALRAQSLDGLMTVHPGRSRSVTSSNPNMNSNRDNFPRINPGRTEVLADIKGPAVIRRIWLTFNEARPGSGRSRNKRGRWPRTGPSGERRSSRSWASPA